MGFDIIGLKSVGLMNRGDAKNGKGTDRQPLKGKESLESKRFCVFIELFWNLIIISVGVGDDILFCDDFESGLNSESLPSEHD